MKVELTALKIKLGNSTIELGVNEAKELYRQLHVLFGERVIAFPSLPVVITPPPWFPASLPTPQWIDTPGTGDMLPTVPSVMCQAREWSS